MNSNSLSLSPLTQLKIPTRFRSKSSTVRFSPTSASLGDDNSRSTQLNLSVLRFTLDSPHGLEVRLILWDVLGIPGLDESYLPRWIGYGFGSLLVLNHFVGSNSATDVASAQLRTEVLGLSLAAFSVVLPYLGKFLKGATTADQITIPEDSEQIFVMSENVSNTQKEDLAWATYILLRNTNTIAVLISVQGELCVRGYWNKPADVSKINLLDWFGRQIEQLGISDVNDTLYFPQISDAGLWEILAKGTRSLLVQPMPQVLDKSDKTMETNQGFILVASTVGYAYSEKDRGWIGALANKFVGNTMYTNF